MAGWRTVGGVGVCTLRYGRADKLEGPDGAVSADAFEVSAGDEGNR